MASKDFIPGTDAGLLSFATPLSAKITATPTAYGLVAGDATSLAALLTSYSTRLATSTDPATRTHAAIVAKNTAKAALIAKIRILARIINADPDTTDEQRADLGLHVRDREPTATPRPITRPTVQITDASGGQSLLRLADELTPTSRKKPAGTSGALLYYKIDGPAPTTAEECRSGGIATKTSCAMAIPAGNTGKTIWVMARWVSPRGDQGPLSEATSALIAA